MIDIYYMPITVVNIKAYLNNKYISNVFTMSKIVSSFVTACNNRRGLSGLRAVNVMQPKI